MANRRDRRSWCNKCMAPVYDEHWREYCGATSIHGVQYLGEAGRPTSERVWWLLVFVGSFALNSYLINQVWKKWNESPVIVTFSEVTTPVWQVPFPAVTICPLTKFDATLYPDVASQLANSDEELEFSKEAADISLLCDIDTVIQGEEFADDNITDFFREIAHTAESPVMHLTFRGQMLNDTRFISEIITEEGPCFVFNMLDYTELFTDQSGLETPNYDVKVGNWSLEKGYSPNEPLNTYPFRVGNSGLKEAFSIVLQNNMSQFDYACQGLTPGFKVTLHNPTQFPDVSGKYFKVQAGNEVIVGVMPDIMTTSDTLKSYTPESRQCYFPNERKLAYYQIYTQENCLKECHTNNTINNCNCTTFYMPRPNSSIPICGPGSRMCALNTEMEMNSNLNAGKSLVTENDYSIEDCKCLPSCNSIRYLTDVSLSTLHIEKFFEALGIENEAVEDMKYSSLVIYFPEKQFTTSRRNELYGSVDFLANCGGLLSLFSGLSLLSIIEIFYFATLRLWNKIHEHRREKRSTSLKPSNA